MDAGNYFMMTGTRMADGGVLAHLTFFNVEENKENELQYVLRESSERLQVIGDFNSENLFYDTAEKRERSLLSATGRLCPCQARKHGILPTLISVSFGWYSALLCFWYLLLA